jgi:hypothetical protein
MDESRKDQMGRRYLDLRTEGRKGHEAEALVNEEFGTNLTGATIRGYASQLKRMGRYPGAPERPKELIVCVDEVSEPPREIVVPIEKASAPPEKRTITVRTPELEAPSTAEALSSTPGELPELDERMRQIAREVFREMLGEATVPITEDIPPEPRTLKGSGKGRRQDREYVKATITVDRNLWALFETERKRLRVSVARMAEILLWRALGRPKLSFEE